MSLIAPTPADLHAATHALRGGGVIAYPTEAVWGLGCDPLNAAAVQQLLTLKQRSPSKGLILIAASVAQIEPWLLGLTPAQKAAVTATWPGPYTWVVPAPTAPAYLRGAHTSIAVRVSAHAGVQALCHAWGGALVSTSANISGSPPASTAQDIQQLFGTSLAHILSGRLGGDQNPSEIRDAVSGQLLRAR